MRVTGGLIPAHLENHQYAWTSDMKGNRVLFQTLSSSVVVWDIAERRYTIMNLEMDTGDDYTTWVRRPLDFSRLLTIS